MFVNIYRIIFIVYEVSDVGSILFKSNVTRPITLLNIDKNANAINKKHLLNKHQIHNPDITNHTALFDLLKFETQLKGRRHKRNSNIWKCLDLCNRSLCPWTEEWDYDAERSPAYIAKAKCSGKCNFNFTDLVTSQILDVLTSCEPFTRDIRIFKNNKETYLKDWPIACTCTRKLISKVPAISNKGRSGQKTENLKKHKRGRHKRKPRRLTLKKLRRLKKLKKLKKRKRWLCRRYNKKKHKLYKLVSCFSANKAKKL